MITDDFADETTNPGLPACTIIGPLLDPKMPARLPYALRYPPVLDEPVQLVVGSDGRLVPEASDDFGDDDADTRIRFALGSRPIGDVK